MLQSLEAAAEDEPEICISYLRRLMAHQKERRLVAGSKWKNTKNRLVLSGKLNLKSFLRQLPFSKKKNVEISTFHWWRRWDYENAVTVDIT
ncbi:hypothetical protein LI177_01035 [bacterium 210820-DFI.6.37]|nr:hypothetical protein [bacterium 210820-DFI.6.37]